MDYGRTKKDSSFTEAHNRPGKADKNGYEDNRSESTESDRDGDKGKAGAYHPDQPDRTLKDFGKWTAKTKEPAQ